MKINHFLLLFFATLLTILSFLKIQAEHRKEEGQIWQSGAERDLKHFLLQLK